MNQNAVISLTNELIAFNYAETLMSTVNHKIQRLIHMKREKRNGMHGDELPEHTYFHVSLLTKVNEELLKLFVAVHDIFQ